MSFGAICGVGISCRVGSLSKLSSVMARIVSISSFLGSRSAWQPSSPISERLPMLYTRNPSGSTPDFTLAYSPECVERLYETPDRRRSGTPPSAQNGLRGHYFGLWCYRRPTIGASPTTFHTASRSSTLAIRLHSRAHRLVVPHMLMELLRCRSPRAIRKKSLPEPTTVCVPRPAHRR